MIKSWEDQQKMGIVSGSHWSSNKQNKTGEKASGNGKKASGGTGASSKPVEKPPESKPNAGNAATTSKNNTTSKTNSGQSKPAKTGETPSENGKKASAGTEASSKPVEKPPESKPGSGSASSSKPNAGNAATTPKNSTTSKTNPEKNETPNEVNTWKPSTKKKDKGEPQANTNKPEENPNKPKDNSKGTEGTGKKTGKLELSDFTEEIMATKPKYAHIPEKWYAKGGHISIDEKGVWTYTNKYGVSVSYPNGYPDFSKYYHPGVKPVKIEYAQPKNYPKDYEAANTEAGLSKTSNPSVPEKNKPPEGYTWHHMEDGKTMVLVEKDVHDEFKHMGGQSIVNGTGGD